MARISIAALLLLLCACAHWIPLKPSLTSAAYPAPLSLTVGSYYSPEFRSYQHSEQQMGDTWIFPLGSASMPLFDQAFAKTFDKVVPIQEPVEKSATSSDLVAVIEPRIESFDFGLPFLKTGTYTANIVYRLVLRAPNGDTIATWTVSGSGAKPGELGFEFARWPGEAADLAMQDAADKFVAGFRNVPEVQAWLRKVRAEDGH